MNGRKWLLLAVALGLMAGAAGMLGRYTGKQKLGTPGVKTCAVPAGGAEDNGKRVRVLVPERVLDYQSEWIDVDSITLGVLPQDTSFGARRYKGLDGFQMVLNVVLMGTDRTSLHKPQFCLEGQGLRIDQTASESTNIWVGGPHPYALPVTKLVATDPARHARALYVYWYVTDGEVSGSATGFDRMWRMSYELFRTGILQRWAYVSLLTECAPGQEQATFERMKQFIAAMVPGLEQAPGSSSTGGESASTQ
jgi:hypothetical protein